MIDFPIPQIAQELRLAESLGRPIRVLGGDGGESN